MSDNNSNFSNLTGSLGNIGTNLSESLGNIGSNLTSSFSNNSENTNNNSNDVNRIENVDNTLTNIRSQMVGQANQLGELQTTIDSLTKTNNDGVNVSSQFSNSYSQYNNNDNTNFNDNRGNQSNLEGLLLPSDLEKKNITVTRNLNQKIFEVKDLFIKNKLNEENDSYLRSYERSTHELDDIKKEKSELINSIGKMNNILNLRLSSIDSKINFELNKRNKLKTKITEEENEDFSFQQRKDDEIQEYRLNIYYILGVFIGSGILIKKLMDYTPKK